MQIAIIFIEILKFRYGSGDWKGVNSVTGMYYISAIAEPAGKFYFSEWDCKSGSVENVSKCIQARAWSFDSCFSLDCRSFQKWLKNEFTFSTFRRRKTWWGNIFSGMAWQYASKCLISCLGNRYVPKSCFLGSCERDTARLSLLCAEGFESRVSLTFYFFPF